MTDKAIVEAVARVLGWRFVKLAYGGRFVDNLGIHRGWPEAIAAHEAITACEAAKEATIEKAGDAFEQGGWQEGMTPYELIPDDEGEGAEGYNV